MGTPRKAAKSAVQIMSRYSLLSSYLLSLLHIHHYHHCRHQIFSKIKSNIWQV